VGILKLWVVGTWNKTDVFPVRERGPGGEGRCCPDVLEKGGSVGNSLIRKELPSGGGSNHFA